MAWDRDLSTQAWAHDDGIYATASQDGKRRLFPASWFLANTNAWLRRFWQHFARVRSHHTGNTVRLPGHLAWGVQYARLARDEQRQLAAEVRQLRALLEQHIADQASVPVDQVRAQLAADVDPPTYGVDEGDEDQ
jgi:hypothetical protein